MPKRTATIDCNTNKGHEPEGGKRMNEVTDSKSRKGIDGPTPHPVDRK